MHQEDKNDLPVKPSHETPHNYRALLGWFLRDAFWRWKWGVAGVLGIGFIASSLRVGTIAQIMLYARAFSSDKPVDLLGWQVHPRESIGFLALFAITTTLMLSLAAVLSYLVARWSTKLWFRHEQFCRDRLLKQLCRPGLVKTDPEAASWLTGILPRALIAHCRYSGRMFRMGLWLPVNFGEFMIASALLFGLHWPLTLVVFGLAALGGLAQRFVNVHGMAATRAFETILPATTRQIRRVQVGVLESTLPASVGEAMRDAVLDGEEQRTFRKVFMTRLTIPQASEMVSEITTALCFLVVILFFGYQAIQKQANWGAMIGYLIAARYALRSMQNSLRLLASVNRFMPLLDNYRRVMQTLDTGHLPDPAVEAMCHGEAAAVMVTDHRPTRLDVLHCLEGLWRDIGCDCDARAARAVLISAPLSQAPPVSAEDFFDGVVESGDELRDWLEAVGAVTDKAEMPSRLDEPIDGHWDKWPPHIRLLLQCYAARCGQASCLVLGPTAATMARPYAKGLCDAMADVEMVFLTRLSSVDDWEATGVTWRVGAYVGGRYRGSGDWSWYAEHREEFEAEAILRAEGQEEDDIDYDDDDDLMM